VVSLKLYVRPGNGHTRVRVFAGEDEGPRAFCGALTLRTDEAHAFLDRFGDHEIHMGDAPVAVSGSLAGIFDGARFGTEKGRTPR
jgi:hypothetical protein